MELKSVKKLKKCMLKSTSKVKVCRESKKIEKFAPGCDLNRNMIKRGSNSRTIFATEAPQGEPRARVQLYQDTKRDVK